MQDHGHNPLNVLLEQKPRTFLNWVKIFAIAIVVLVIIGTVTTYVWAQKFDDKIAPGISIGPINVGGMDPEQARKEINDRIDSILTNGIEVKLRDEIKTIPLSIVGPTNSDANMDYVEVDIENIIEKAMATYRQSNPIVDSWTVLFSKIYKKQIPITFTIYEELITSSIKDTFSNEESIAMPPKFLYEETQDGWIAHVAPPRPGKEFVFDKFFNDLKYNLENLSHDQIELVVEYREPEVTKQEAETLIDQVNKIVNYSPYALTYNPDRYTSSQWILDNQLAREIIQPQKTDAVTLGFDKEKIASFYGTIANKINKKAVDARIVIENGRVIEFIPSEDGVVFNENDTTQNLFELFKIENGNTAEIVTEKITPEVKTSNVNNLGINELLGVGESNFSGSPWNRIQNIKNGAKLLNGILIKPDEEFSLLNALKPFSSSNGYLPELVIKGDKIVPEMGGGLCQIGTTTFRATMNSGLPITQRRNHSLVVNYYNDPSNGKPGTDATIYDPAPDFKFINNTGHYILFQTEVDEVNKKLKFNFWGTSDGRIGRYSAPAVTRWIPAGETINIETEDLKSGEQQCQFAHPGADAEFTYTVEHTDGTKEETLYVSHYRSIPKICLVGKTL